MTRPDEADTGDQDSMGVSLESPGTPRWVKLFVAVILAVALLVVVLLLTGRGGHGPGRHTGAVGSRPDTSPAGIGVHSMRR